ncbi:ParB/RepB/Spo0J family partition protein [Eilatimonas milleporae]|uniref:ParB family chromosome partitioning protein n=1 Tax=Eilatimonas milleporae TaxID=911205 RepID=A0A3M0CE20_9PROT|nr:ParB/RepB/Spo0J family partition protein [Eilatimonas milleporae]RMB04986.1 ParB family chromosome partitioning protein [Eilatimonas milleporae]
MTKVNKAPTPQTTQATPAKATEADAAETIIATAETETGTVTEQPADAFMIPLDRLDPATSNVRKGPLTGIDVLAKSLFATGQQQSLKVRAFDNGRFEVIAGSRRLAAFKLLIKQKKILPTHPVACIVDNVPPMVPEAVQQLTENTMRQAMNPVDEYEAYAELLEAGASVGDLAKQFSATARHIKQRIRLGSLAEPIREALREDEITLDIAKAFGGEPDTERQLQVWQALKNRGHFTAYTVSEAIRENSYAEDHRLAVFVGLDAYRAKGGRIVEDLFQKGSRLVDGALLENLAQAKLQAEADKIGTGEGFKWAETSLKSHIPTYGSTKITRTTRPMTEPEKAEETRILSKIDILTEKAEAEADQKTENDIRALNDRLSVMHNARTDFNPAEKAVAGVKVYLDSNGDVQTVRGLVRDEDVPALKVLRNTGQPSPAKKAKTSGPKYYSGKLQGDLTAERTAALRYGVLRNYAEAPDLMLYSLARNFNHRSTSNEPISMPIGFIDNRTSAEYKIQAEEKITEFMAELDRSFLDKPFWDGYAVFRALSNAKKDKWAAAILSRQVTRASAWTQGKHDDHDILGSRFKVVIRTTFKPDGAFLNRLTKDQLLDIADKIGGKQFRLDLGSLKKAELVTALAGVFDGSAQVYGKDVIKKARTWTPDHMDFPTSKPAQKAPVRKPAPRTAKGGRRPASAKTAPVKKAA